MCIEYCLTLIDLQQVRGPIECLLPRHTTHVQIVVCVVLASYRKQWKESKISFFYLLLPATNFRLNLNFIALFLTHPENNRKVWPCKKYSNWNLTSRLNLILNCWGMVVSIQIKHFHQRRR